VNALFAKDRLHGLGEMNAIGEYFDELVSSAPSPLNEFDQAFVEGRFPTDELDPATPQGVALFQYRYPVLQRQL
jgi:hypothetical protein